MTQKSHSRALFAGTFNPFTIGHRSIVDRGLRLFDTVVVAVGVNADKPDSRGVAHTIRQLYADEPRVEVVEYTGLTAEFARRVGADVLLRGVRSVKDYEYELAMADANRHLTGIETVLLPALPELAWVSSSVVRDIVANGGDVSALLPHKNC